MKKTYATTVPDHIGAFLAASKVFSELGMNITRTSYNKAVDSGMIFIDAEGTAEQHEKATELLKDSGYLQPQGEEGVVLLEFKLTDKPGSVMKVLELIQDFGFNISYISSQEDGSEFQHFKMGLFVDDKDRIERFIREVDSLCPVRVIDYNHSEKSFDNSIFYNSFVRELTTSMGLDDNAQQELLINTNLAMQTLDEQGLSPYKTFDNISRFAGLLAAARGDNFNPRITSRKISDRTEILLIEPPCGSNTAILHSDDRYLFIDCGYACYREEMLPIIKSLVPEFNSIHKQILITHADVDHCGLLSDFDEILANSRSAECLRLEFEDADGFREQNPLHKPYIRICKTLTSYRPVPSCKVKTLWQSPDSQTSPLVQIGFLDFEEFHFEVYEGFGGHLPGEILLIDYDLKVVFTGDIFVNLKGMTPAQAQYNKCAPVLMTSVDTDPLKNAAERDALFKRLGSGSWLIYGAHGEPKEYNV